MGTVEVRPAKRSRGRVLHLALTIALLASFTVAPAQVFGDPSWWTTIDEAESNDTAGTANVLPPDGTIVNGAYTAGDQDWYSIDVISGVTYVFETGPNTEYLDVMEDTYLFLYDSDGISQISSDDDGGAGAFSYIQWTADADKTVFVMTRHYSSGSGTGPYGLRVYEYDGTPLPDTEISGVVTDGTAPLEDIVVESYHVHNGDPWFAWTTWSWNSGPSTTTAADGTYSLTCAGGANVVQFIDPTGAHYGQFYSGAYTPADLTPVLESSDSINAVMLPRMPFDTPFTTITRMSVDEEGMEGEYGSREPAISADGRFVAFVTPNAFVADDENGYHDIYVRDTVEGTITRVSVSTDGGDPDGDSWSPSISADGRYVAFYSYGSNLVEGDTNGSYDVFVYDMETGETVRASVAMDGGDPDSESYEPSISDDGRYVAFDSYASNLVEGDTDPDEGNRDVFVYDMETGETVRVSVDNDGNEGSRGSRSPSISGDGRYVAFVTGSAFVEDDTNDYRDIYVRDMAEDTIFRVSVGLEGDDPNDDSDYPSISADGRYVAFESDASNLVFGDDNYAEDGPEPDAAGRAGDEAEAAAKSDDDSAAKPGSAEPANGSEGESDIFRVDLVTGETVIVSADPNRLPANDGSWEPAISADGSRIAFESYADNLVADDMNGRRDVFLAAAEEPGIAIEQHDAGVVFDRFVTGSSDAYSGGGYIYSRWAGSHVTAKFKGNKVRWVGPKQPSYGKADVYIDGVKAAAVDCYASAGEKTTSAVLFESTTLSDGPHTIQIRLTGAKNAASTGYFVVLDRFEVEGENPMGAGFRMNEKQSGTSFAGGWVHPTNPNYVGGGYAYSYWRGSVFHATFTGTKVAWIGPKFTTYGRAAIYIDGAYVGTFSQYGAKLGWRERVWESGNLTPGVHTLSIRPLGTKDAASTGTVIVIDAVDVTPVMAK